MTTRSKVNVGLMSEKNESCVIRLMKAAKLRCQFNLAIKVGHTKRQSKFRFCGRVGGLTQQLFCPEGWFCWERDATSATYNSYTINKMRTNGPVKHRTF